MINYIVFPLTPPCVNERDGESQGAGWVVVGGKVRCAEGLLPKNPTKNTLL